MHADNYVKKFDVTTMILGTNLIKYTLTVVTCTYKSLKVPISFNLVRYAVRHIMAHASCDDYNNICFSYYAKKRIIKFWGALLFFE